METVALKCWVIRDVTETSVTMEEQANGGPTGQLVEFERRLLPDDVRVGDEFRVVAQIDRARQEAGQEAGSMDSVLAEATEALTESRARGA